MRRKGKFLCNLDQSLLVLFFIGIVYSLFPSCIDTSNVSNYDKEVAQQKILVLFTKFFKKSKMHTIFEIVSHEYFIKFLVSCFHLRSFGLCVKEQLKMQIQTKDKFKDQ